MIRCIFLVLILAGILTGGCGEQSAPVQNAGAKTVILYSELDNKFTENLVEAFNKEQKDKLQLKAIYELKPGGAAHACRPEASGKAENCCLCRW